MGGVMGQRWAAWGVCRSRVCVCMHAVPAGAANDAACSGRLLVGMVAAAAASAWVLLLTLVPLYCLYRAVLLLVPQLGAKDQIITAEPDITCHPITPADAFLVLACDGIWDVMDK